MKTVFCVCLILFVLFLLGPAAADFTGKGHVHTHSETKQVFLNPQCRTTASCDLKRFTLTTAVNEIWFSDDPKYPTYGNGVIMEYETDSVAALEKYAIVQFMKGCVFHSSLTGAGQVKRTISDTIMSFGESVPYCFPNWVIDSRDTDPAYNSDPQYGRIYLARWNRPGSYDNRTQKYYGIDKPKIPVVYMNDYPSGAYVSGTSVKNAALEFKTCIYKAGDVPAETHRQDINFAKPINCFEWQSVYVYDFEKTQFLTDLASIPSWDEPARHASTNRIAIVCGLLLALTLGIFFGFRALRNRRPRF